MKSDLLWICTDTCRNVSLVAGIMFPARNAVGSRHSASHQAKTLKPKVSCFIEIRLL